MKGTDNKKQIRRDCLSYMKGVAAAQFLVDLASVLIPTLTASIFGEMINALLQASYAQARSLLPSFILYMGLSVLTVPFFTMVEFLCMGKRGYDYDMFMVKRLLRKPLSEIQQYDVGDILERLEGTLGDFSWNTASLFSLPLSVVCYMASTLFLLHRQGMPLAVVLLVIAIPSLPVLKAHLTGGKKALYERKQAEYNERRKTEEMSLCASKPFLLAYHMENHTAKMLGSLFRQYMRQDGEKKVRFQAGLDALDFLLQHAVPLCILAIGIALAKAGSLPVGVIVAGYLVLPSIERCYQYIARFVEELHASGEYYARLAIFYGETEPETGNAQAETDAITAENLSFTYAASTKKAVEDASISLSKGDIILLVGPNGCGKSTLSRLLSGLYQPQSGKLQSHEGTALNVIDLRRLVTIQEQTSAVFQGTVLENLFIEASQVPRAQSLMTSLKLEKGLDDAVEADGVNLSPGEKKKLQLIRTLMRSTPFYILDEPLNHMDETGKKETECLLMELSRHHGILIISHRDMKLPVPHMQKIRMQEGKLDLQISIFK